MREAEVEEVEEGNGIIQHSFLWMSHLFGIYDSFARRVTDEHFLDLLQSKFNDSE